MENYIDQIKNLKIDEDGRFNEPGLCEGLPIKRIMATFRDSSWDYPSMLAAFFPKMDMDHAPMHPDMEDMAAWNTHIKDTDYMITMEDLEFDT